MSTFNWQQDLVDISEDGAEVAEAPVPLDEQSSQPDRNDTTVEQPSSASNPYIDAQFVSVSSNLYLDVLTSIQNMTDTAASLTRSTTNDPEVMASDPAAPVSHAAGHGGDDDPSDLLSVQRTTEPDVDATADEVKKEEPDSDCSHDSMDVKLEPKDVVKSETGEAGTPPTPAPPILGM